MPLVAVIGPSGCGKSSVVRELVRRGAAVVHPTWTTRPRRRDERRGCLEHRFVSDGRFDALSARGFFLATANPFGLRWRYGLPDVRPVADHRIDVLMLRAPVVESIRDLLPITRVVQIEDEQDRIRHRLVDRRTPPDELEARLADNELEVVLGREVADVTLVNDDSIVGLATRLLAAAHPAGVR